jgi:hypothetical protein
MKRPREDEYYKGTTMFDALLRSQIERSGGGKNYASRIGVVYSTLWRWLERDINPLYGTSTAAKDRLVDDLSLPKEDLQRLQEITVREACDIILNQSGDVPIDVPATATERETTPTIPYPYSRGY